MKKIIFLFLIFSCIVFAEWEYSMLPNKYGANFHRFTVFDYKINSRLTVNVSLVSFGGHAGVKIYNDNVKESDNLSLYIVDNSGDSMNYTIFNKDIENGYISVENLDGFDRGMSLIKLLLSSQYVELFSNDAGKRLATFDTKGLKQILEKKLGDSYWYKYKLND